MLISVVLWLHHRNDADFVRDVRERVFARIRDLKIAIGFQNSAANILPVNSHSFGRASASSSFTQNRIKSASMCCGYTGRWCSVSCSYAFAVIRWRMSRPCEQKSLQDSVIDRLIVGVAEDQIRIIERIVDIPRLLSTVGTDWI
jgi:hypothetical protein